MPGSKRLVLFGKSPLLGVTNIQRDQLHKERVKTATAQNTDKVTSIAREKTEKTVVALQLFVVFPFGFSFISVTPLWQLCNAPPFAL